MLRDPDGWRMRTLSGARWNMVRGATERAFTLNTYRVLLTRARYKTVIWIPPGSPAGDAWHDPTRDAAEMDAVAAYLLACGARPLEATPATETLPGLL
ncbi:hypothetical protein FHS87_002569 [Roseomonas pecuniae]|uniref:Uncharacterized protein n=1 Tax=Muricoccus pecuniae TaxID=693023 RepID=A0A840YJU3_9PROT|nr:hypothetical protein [Roseomonas pecuniae]